MKRRIPLLVLGTVGAFAVLYSTSSAQSVRTMSPPSAPQGAASVSLEVELVEPGVFSTGLSELTTTFSPDQQHALWSVSTPAYGRWITIVESHRANGKWSTPAVPSFSGRWIDADPFFTEDGRRLYFLSRRPLDGGTQPERGYRVWYVDRTARGWGEPAALPSHVNNSDMHYVVPVRDGSLYITSIRQDSRNQGDIYRVPWRDNAWGEPVNLGPVINAADIHDTTPYVPQDESYIIFASTRSGGVGGLDLYISLRDGNGWTAPKLLPSPINSNSRDFCPIGSPDGKWLYFTSDRGFADAPLSQPKTYAEMKAALESPGNGVGDVYRTSLPALLEWARRP